VLSPGFIDPHLVVKRSYSRSTMHAKIFVLFSALAYGLAQECENNFPDGSDCSIFEHKMEDPDDCTSFWWCVDGCPVKQKCEADYLYGIEDSNCRDNNKVDCGTRPCLDPSHCPSEHPTTQVCDHPVDCNELGNGWFQDDYNCRKYWHCFDGQGDHMLCPPGQLYNAEKIWCDWRENVNCGARPICGECDADCEYPVTTTTVTPCKHECTVDGVFAEGCCENSFCQCFGHLGVLQHCGKGLVFNDVTHTCDYTFNVDCCSN